MFKNIDEAFISMTEMIAEALVMKALGILMPAAGLVAGPPLLPESALAVRSFRWWFYRRWPTHRRPRWPWRLPAMVHPQETIIDHHGAMNCSPGGAGGGAVVH